MKSSASRSARTRVSALRSTAAMAGPVDRPVRRARGRRGRVRLVARALVAGRLDRADRLAGDRELLVGRDHHHQGAGPVRGDDRRLLLAAGVAVRVHRDAQRFQALERAGADDRVVLADARGERDDVDPAEHRVVGADVLAQPVQVDVERQRARPRRRRRPASCSSRKSFSPAQPLEAGAAVEQVVDVVDATCPALRCRWMRTRGVDVARPGAHDQALQRGQAHRRLDRDAAADRRRRRAVAQVQHDLVEVLGPAPEHSRDLAGHVLVRRPVEPVPADPVLARRPRGRSRSVAAASGSVRKNAVSNTATCGTSGSSSRATWMPVRLAGLCSGASGERASICGDDLVVDDQRARRTPRRRAPPGGRPRPRAPARGPARPPSNRAEHGPQAGAVVGDRVRAARVVLPPYVCLTEPVVLADPLDDARRRAPRRRRGRPAGT